MSLLCGLNESLSMSLLGCMLLRSCSRWRDRTCQGADSLGEIFMFFHG
jgi:hypothetical protein